MLLFADFKYLIYVHIGCISHTSYLFQTLIGYYNEDSDTVESATKTIVAGEDERYYWSTD